MRLASRNGNDLGERFLQLVHGLDNLPDETVVDGEIVALDKTGRPSFNLLQNFRNRGTVIEYYAFDLLHVCKWLLERPLNGRRELLRSRVMPRLTAPIRFSETLHGSAAKVIAAIKARGLEGVIAKRRNSRYEPATFRQASGNVF